MRSPLLAALAAAVLMIEAIGLFAVVVIESAQLGTATSLGTALALIALTAITAGLLAVLSAGVFHGRSWARSGAVVLHILGVILTFAAITTDPPSPALAVTVGIPSVLGLVLLILSARAEGRVDETPDAASDESAENSD